MSGYQRLGEILLRKGKLTQQQLDAAIAARAGQRRRLGRMLIGLGFATDRDIAECLAEQYELDLVDPRRLTPSQEALSLMNGDLALDRKVLPIDFTQQCLECAIADPIDFPTTDMIARMAGRTTVFHIAPESALITAIQKAYHLEGVEPWRSNRRSKGARKQVVPKHPKDRDAILARLESAPVATL